MYAISCACGAAWPFLFQSVTISAETGPGFEDVMYAVVIRSCFFSKKSLANVAPREIKLNDD